MRKFIITGIAACCMLMFTAPSFAQSPKTPKAHTEQKAKTDKGKHHTKKAKAPKSSSSK